MRSKTKARTTGEPRLLRHKISEVFGTYVGTAKFRQLIKSISNEGLLTPIVTFEGRILDGWHRYLACLEAGIEPRFQPYDGYDTPTALLAYAVGLNCARRQMSATQLAVAAARLAMSEKTTGLKYTLEQAGAAFHVGESSVLHAHAVLKQGAPALVKLMERDELSTKAAYALICDLNEGEQAVLAEEGPAAVQARVRQIRRESRKKKAAEHERQILDRAAVPPAEIPPAAPAATSPGSSPATPPRPARPAPSAKGADPQAKGNDPRVKGTVLTECLTALETLKARIPLLLSTPEGKRFRKYAKLLRLSWFNEPETEFTGVHLPWLLLSTAAQSREMTLDELTRMIRA